MSLDAIFDVVSWVLLLLGAFLSLAAGVGLVRFPDVVSRLHAVTKPQILGVMLVLAAIAVEERSWATLLAVTPVLVFQMITAPIAAHMIGRAAHRADDVPRENLHVDELADAGDPPSRRSRSRSRD